MASGALARRNVRLTLAFRALDGTATGIWAGSLLVAYISMLFGSNPAGNQKVGVAQAVLGTSLAATAVPLAWLADKKLPRHNILRAAGAISAVAVAATVHALLADEGRQFNLLCFALVLWGVAQGAGPVQDALFADSVATGSRATVYTAAHVASVLSKAVGPLLSAALFARSGGGWSLGVLRAVLLCGLALALAPACLLLLFCASDLGAASEGLQAQQLDREQRDFESGAARPGRPAAQGKASIGHPGRKACKGQGGSQITEPLLSECGCEGAGGGEPQQEDGDEEQEQGGHDGQWRIPSGRWGEVDGEAGPLLREQAGVQQQRQDHKQPAAVAAGAPDREEHITSSAWCDGHGLGGSCNNRDGSIEESSPEGSPEGGCAASHHRLDVGPGTSGTAACSRLAVRQGAAQQRRQLFSPAMVPLILAVSECVSGLASGMTVEYFPVFFKDEVGLSPVSLCILLAVVPACLTAASMAARCISRHAGRVQTIAAFKATGVCLLLLLATRRGLWRRQALVMAVYVLRTSAMNATYPLEKSIVMDYSPSDQRGRWNSLDAVTAFGWSGSALLGGWIIQWHGFATVFLATACMQLVSLGMLSVLVWIVPRCEAPAGHLHGSES